MQAIGHTKRINRDIHDLMNHDFDSVSASVLVEEVPSYSSGVHEYLNTSSSSSSARTVWSVNLTVCPFEGPYRGGHFLFTVKIADSYPFVGPDVWVGSPARPIWHPNIEMDTGRVMLPLEWSPVLTLVSLVLAIQMMLLEPSADHPLNLEACSYYTQSSAIFEQQVQRTLNGCVIRDTYFATMRQVVCKCCMNKGAPFGRSNRSAQGADANLSHLTEEFDMILDTGSQNEADSMGEVLVVGGIDGNKDGLRAGKSPKKRGSSALDLADERENEGVGGNCAEFSPVAENSVEGSAHKRNRIEWTGPKGVQQPVVFGQAHTRSVFRYGAANDEIEGGNPNHPL